MAIPHNSARANPEKKWVLMMALFCGNTLCISRKSDEIRAHFFQEAPKADCAVLPYVIATRIPLPELPYSTKEIYGIRNKAGNRFQGTKRLYAEFFPLVKQTDTPARKPDLVIVEDSNAGYAFFQHYFGRHGIRCVSANGKTKIFHALLSEEYQTALVIADGAAFGPEIERVLSLRQVRNMGLYLPESFEWIVLRSDVLDDPEIRAILSSPENYIASEDYFSWEQFFTELLSTRSRDTYLAYAKRRLNQNCLQDSTLNKIAHVFPDGLLE